MCCRILYQLRLSDFGFPFTESSLISSSLSTHMYTDHVDSGGKNIVWSNIGFELTVPYDAVPEGKIVRIAVISSQTSPFPLPPEMELVSPVFLVAVSPEMRFLKFVGLSLKHSAKLGSKRACLLMTFVAARSTTAAPSSLQLKPLAKGHFPPNSNMASIALDSLPQALAVTRHKQHRVAHGGTGAHSRIPSLSIIHVSLIVVMESESDFCA